MINEFVPYEESFLLKEMGFNEPCLCAYDKNQMLYHSHITDGKMFRILNSNLSTQCSAPLWQQAFNWFRETHNLHGELSSGGKPNMYTVFIKEYIYENNNPKLFTYEDAQLSLLRELIKLVK